jgi:hypothetical protein
MAYSDGFPTMNDLIRADTSRVASTIPFDDSPTRWFIRGIVVSMLSMAAINALSFFVRSADWQGLVGPPNGYQESLGFPLVIWEGGNTYGGMFVDYPSLSLNVLFAAVVGSFVGMIAARQSKSMNALIRRLQSEADGKEHQPIQFSLSGLLVATAMMAVIATLARHYAARPETLVAIYVLGPVFLVAIAMLPRKLAWEKRVMIIIPATLTLIAVAIVVGVALGMEFDKVMLGVFLCWTPQSVIAAVGLTAWVLIAQARASSVG